jgi:hypothetical protein
MLGVRFLPRGPLRFGEAGPDPWVPRALASRVRLPFSHDVSVIIGGSALMLDQPDPTLGGWTSREQQ